MLFLRFHDRGDRIRCNKHIYQCLTSKIRHLLSICCSFIHAMICCSPNVTDKHWQLNYVYVYIYIWLLYMYTVCVSFLQYYMHIFLQRMPYIDGCFSCRWTFISARDSGEACGHRTGPTGAWRCTESCIRKTFLETDAIQYENQMGYLTIKKLGNIGI